MEVGDITMYSIVRIKASGRKAIVTGYTVWGNTIVGVAVKYPQGKPVMYKPTQLEVIRY